MEFNERIKARRLQLGLTTDEVSKIVGVSNATISRWETATIKNQRRDKLERLAIALKVTPAELLGWTKEQSSEETGFDNELINLDKKRKGLIDFILTTDDKMVDIMWDLAERVRNEKK